MVNAMLGGIVMVWVMLLFFAVCAALVAFAFYYPLVGIPVLLTAIGAFAGYTDHWLTE